VAEFVAYAKKQPISYAHGGPGMRNTDDCDQSFQRIATSVTRVRDGAVG
jgi:hypothetical protein